MTEGDLIIQLALPDDETAQTGAGPSGHRLRLMFDNGLSGHGLAMPVRPEVLDDRASAGGRLIRVRARDDEVRVLVLPEKGKIAPVGAVADEHELREELLEPTLAGVGAGATRTLEMVPSTLSDLMQVQELFIRPKTFEG